MGASRSPQVHLRADMYIKHTVELTSSWERRRIQKNHLTVGIWWIFFPQKFLAKFSSQLCLFSPYICEMAQSKWDIEYVEWNSKGIVLSLHII